MINIDDRILPEVKDSEFWFLMHLAKRIRNSSESCFPSMSTIGKDTGYGEKKCLSVKKSLMRKAKIEVVERYTKHGMRTSDGYIIKDKKITIMMGIDEVQSLKKIINEQNKIINKLLEKIENPNVSGTPQKGRGHPPQKGRRKLLTNETNTIVEFENSTTDEESDEIKETNEIVKKVIDYFNKVSERKFSSKTKKTIKEIKARLNDGYSLEDFKKVIDIKTAQWKDDPDNVIYLRPSTLFIDAHFDEYLNQPMVENKSNVKDDTELTEDQEITFRETISYVSKKYPLLKNTTFSKSGFKRFTEYYLHPMRKRMITIEGKKTLFGKLWEEMSQDKFFSKKHGDFFAESFERFETYYEKNGFNS